MVMYFDYDICRQNYIQFKKRKKKQKKGGCNSWASEKGIISVWPAINIDGKELKKKSITTADGLE